MRAGAPAIHAGRAGSIAVWQPILQTPLQLPAAAVEDTAPNREANAEAAGEQRAEEFTAQELAQRLRIYASRRDTIGPSGKLY